MRPSASGAIGIPRRSDEGRYEAVLRLSEAPFLVPSARGTDEDPPGANRRVPRLPPVLRHRLQKNSTEVEWAVLGGEKSVISVYADVPVRQRPSWQARSTQTPFHISDWNADKR